MSYFVNKKVKIVYIIEALGGGVYTYFKSLLPFLDQQEGKTIYLIYSGKRKEVNPDKIRGDFPKSVHLIEVDMERNLAPIQDIKATLKIRKILLEIQPDIIHLHSSKAGVIGRWAAAISRIKAPVFYTPHGYSFLKLDISKNKRNLFYNIEKYTQKIFGGTTIACGESEYEMARKIGPSTLINNGIRLEQINAYRAPHFNKRLTFGTLGRILPQKNPELFNQIALLHPQYDFIWIGDGENRNLLTAPNIKITGWSTNNLEIFPLLNQVDVYLQTSLWEGLPIAILEAMALKKPILATDIAGNRDLVEPGKNGYLFQSATDTLALLKKFESKIEIEKMGVASSNMVLEHFDTEKNFEKMLKIYEEACLKFKQKTERIANK